MALLRFALAAILYTSAAHQPSPGCVGSGNGWVPNIHSGANTINVDKQPPRKFIVNVGAGVQRSVAAPLLFSFHWQYGNAVEQKLIYRFAEISHDVIAVYPQGLDDFVPGDSKNPNVGTGWNVGSAGDNTTCVAADVQGNSCYASCQALGKCGPCNWSTCYDDVLFVTTMLELMAQNFCIDLDRVYVHGVSNGGMMTHFLLQKLPNVFAAAVPQYAVPLYGYETYPAALNHTAVLSLYDRRDTVIPWGPRRVNEAYGWLYPSLFAVMSDLAAVHGCSPEAESIASPWDGGFSNFKCFEHQSCKSGKNIKSCLYSGHHGSNPLGNSTEGHPIVTEIIMWFLLPFSRGSNATMPAALEQSASPAELLI